MADDVKTVTPIAGTTLYTGVGLHPVRLGEVASVPADHADDLARQGVVEHVVPPAPVPPG
jgi:hypothetical protein